MDLEFTKLSEVEVTENPTEEANVLIEEANGIKRTPKSKIGVQADWNETDETKLSCILNKPEKFNYVKHYYISYADKYMFETDCDWTYPESLTPERAITMDEFKNDYFSGCTCIINRLETSELVSAAYGTVIGFQPYPGLNTVGVVLHGCASTTEATTVNFRQP